jgi:K+:H+ antiporter
MQHHDVIVLALQVGAMLTAALVCGQIMRALSQPAVLGELLGGILLGPTVLGALAPHAYAWLFPATGAITVGRDAMLKIGMLFFMFVAGLEVNPAYLHKRSRSVIGASLLVHLHRSFYAIEAPVIYSGYETTNLYPTLD